jgi:hypothetical protein
LLHGQRHAERTTYVQSHHGRKGDARSLDELRTDIAVARLLGPDQATAADTDTRGAADMDKGAAATAADECGNASATNAANDGQSDDDNAHTGAKEEPVPPVSGLNPAVGVEVVIHCTFDEAAALASGAISTGGDLDGYGPLPQDALALAFRRAKFRYRLTDREPVSDPARHDPSLGLAQHVRDRDRRCRFPGCNSPAVHCDLDHRVAFPEGATDAHNLEPLCRHHHRLKHLGDWQVFNTDDGTLIWISPTGRAYFDPPALPRAA